MEVTTSALCRVLDYAESARRAASASVFGWIGTPHKSERFEEVEESVGGSEAKWLRCGDPARRGRPARPPAPGHAQGLSG